MKKVSIIIPNYNNCRYLKDCLQSVINQDYPYKEIIIVDDGSIDKSVTLIKEFIRNNLNIDIKLICQNNLNAAMARNRGMEIATGDYVLFLDSDDMLEKGVLNKLVGLCKKKKADLIIGGYEEIDKDNKQIGSKAFTTKDELLEAEEENFIRLLNINPVPSNKLYSLEIIRKNNLSWGNVRIGQDLDFYVKYLLLCKKVMLASWNIYKYRITCNSMSKVADFRIFDIVNVFDDIKNFCIKNNMYSLYEKYIVSLELKHFDFQLSKQLFLHSYKARKLVVDYFDLNEKKINYSNCTDKDATMAMRRKFRIKCVMKRCYTSNMYRKYKIWKKRNEKQ